MKMLTLRREPKETKTYTPSDSSIAIKREYKCLLINHPELQLDIDGVKFITNEALPKMASLQEGVDIKPIIVYLPGNTSPYLPKAEGFIKLRILRATMNLFPKTISFELGDGFVFLTPDYIYNDEQSSMQSNATNKEILPVSKFIDSIGLGDVYDDAMNMGPQQLARDIEMPELTRVIGKPILNKLMDNLNNMLKTAMWAILGSIVLFGIFLYAGT